MSAYYNQRPPGKLVGIIAVKPKGLGDNEYNPLVLAFTVNPYRKDLRKEEPPKPPFTNYSRSLLKSMFKNWGIEDEPTRAQTTGTQ